MIPETSTPSTAESHISPRSIFLYWLPVIAALAVFGQVAVLGLRPALAEDRRLADATQVLVDRYQAAVAESDRLARLLRAQQDPVLLERERREQLVNPRAPGEER
ncbi:MAG: hypothetical protein ABI054_01735 [Planctomycetota bacterium]